MFGSKKKTEAAKEEEVEMAEKGAAKEQTQQQNQAPEVGEMKRGDYMIHVLIEKGKDFLVPENSTIDPMIELTCLNQKIFSSSKDKIGGLGEVVWNEHLFIEPRNVEKRDAEDAKIVIKLVDKDFFRNSLIGMFEFDLSYIYFMKDHILRHQWLAISNPNSEDYSKITGYLKVSISVTATGDDQIQMKEDLEDTKADNVMMPPQLNPKFYQIKVRIFQAQDLAPLDKAVLFGKPKIDAYFMTTVKKRKLKTRTLMMEKDGDARQKPIDFNQEFWIPAQIPIISSKLVIHLMDEDTIKDEMAGSLQFDVKSIIEGGDDGKFVWKNIYGSPLDQPNSEFKTQMNNDPEIASNWKGRVLMQFICEPTDKPVAKVVHISQEVINEAKDKLRDKAYDVIAEIGQAVALPQNKKYQIKMIIGGYTLQTQPAKVHKKNYNRFNERFDQQTIKLPYVDICDFGKILILLMDDNQPICYYSDHINNFTDPNAQYKWVSFMPDKCVNSKLSPNSAGMISFKLSIHDVTKNGPLLFREFESWKKPPVKRAVPVCIRAYIYQCRDLPAADSNGTSDPFVKIWDMSDKEKQTAVIEDNNNPLYFEVVELDYEVRDINDLESYPPFILDVWDQDKELFGDNYDYLARAIIEPEDCSIMIQAQFEKNKDLEIPPVPRWHPLHYRVGDPPSGEILVSFAVSEIEYLYTMPAQSVDLRQRVEFQEFDVSMLILGLRELESPGILPVKKAFIQFNIKSLVPPNSTAIENIQTQPKSPGSNPTINTTMNFSIPLPVDPLYCPRLACQVYDNIIKGLNQPLIGTFTVPIGELMLEMKDERMRETQAIQEIIDKLKAIMGDQYQSRNYLNQSKAIEKSQSNKQYHFGDNSGSSINYVDTVTEDDESTRLIQNREESSLYKSKTKRLPSKNIDIKKQIQKTMKGSEVSKDGFEQFGANESGGINNAIQRKEQVIESAEKRINKLKNQNEEDDGQGVVMGRKNSVNKLKDRLDSQSRGSIAAKNKKDLMAQLQADSEQLKRIKQDERQRELENMGEQGTHFIIMPKYRQDQRLKVDREYESPSDQLFIGLGWDEDRTTQRKHYRYFYPDELENVKEIFPQKSPFNTYELKRGQTRGLSKGGLFSLFRTQKEDASGQVSTEQTVGYFKGIIEVESKEDRIVYRRKKQQLLDQMIDLINQVSMKKSGKPIHIDIEQLSDAMERKRLEYEFRNIDIADLNITKHLANLESEEILRRSLLAQTKCIVRVYMISAINLSSRDNGSPSDPYLVLSCNNVTYNEREFYQLDEANPNFFKKFDFEGVFPGCSPLRIEVYDYDEIFSDDIIGTTVIDLEDRYFSLEWQALQDKPIEQREIFHPSSSISQGALFLWVEINPVNSKPEQIKTWDITPRPPMDMEIRIVVFCAEGMKLDFSGTADIYFRGFIDSKEEVQETDTHYRNQDGKPDYQYRFVYRIKVPRKDYKFTLQAFDRDLFSSNDLIGEVSFSIKDVIEDCLLVKKPINLNKKYYEEVLKQKKYEPTPEFDQQDQSRFWIPLKAKDPNNGKEIQAGKVKIQVDVLPGDQASKNPVGKAREQPNHSPTLPEPEGRVQLSINPFKMYEQLVGPVLRRKIRFWVIIIACIALILTFLPFIASFIPIISAISGLFSS